MHHPTVDCNDITIFPLFFSRLLRSTAPRHAVSPWGHGPLVGGTVVILLFFLCFSLDRSVLLLPLLSALPPTHDPPIFPYFVNRHHASHFSALLCQQT